jgi:regulator of nucleoside diphosphate kinase
MMNQKRLYVTINDYKRIIGLIEFAALKTKIPDLVERILGELKGAQLLPSENISRDVITMNSRVLLTDMSSGRKINMTVTYPQDADSRQRKVSLFSPIGAALLGRRVGDVASWKMPQGTGRFRVDKIVYQPESEGDFHL